MGREIEKQYYTRREIADILKVTYQSVYKTEQRFNLKTNHANKYNKKEALKHIQINYLRKKGIEDLNVVKVLIEDLEKIKNIIFRMPLMENKLE